MLMKKISATVLALVMSASSLSVMAAFADETEKDTVSLTERKLQADSVPSAPTNASASLSADGKTLTLNWKAPSSAVEGYFVYREHNGKYEYEMVRWGATTFTFSDYADHKMSDGWKYYVKSFNTKSSVSWAESEDDVLLSSSLYFSANSTEVSAPTNTTIYRGNKSTNSVRLFWYAIACDGYEIYYTDSDTDYTFLADVDKLATEYKINGLKSNTKYRFIIKAYNKTADGVKIYGASSPVKVVTTKAADSKVTSLDKVNIKRGSQTADSVSIEWDAVKNAQTYQITLSADGETWTRQPTVTGTSATIKGLSPNHEYWIAVRAYAKNSDATEVVGEWSDNYHFYTDKTVTSIGKVKITKMNKTYDAVRPYWEPVDDADGYEVYWETGGSSMQVFFSTGNNYRIQKLQPETTYHVKVRAYKNGSEIIYGEWSDTISVTTTKKKPAVDFTTLTDPEISKVNVTYDAIRPFWGKVKNAQGYEVVMSDKTINGPFTYTYTTTSDNYRIEGLKQGKTYYVSVRAYATNNQGKKIYSDWAYNKAATTKVKSTVTKPAKPTITKTSTSKDAVRLTWEPVNCDGYFIYQYINGSWERVAVVKGGDSYTKRITKLYSNSRYAFRIQAYRFKNGVSGSKVLSDYSGYVNVTTKKA